MNRKGIREQNDISIIIGNLPKRLQKKIADEVAFSVDNNEAIRTERDVHSIAMQKECKTTTPTCAPVLEASGALLVAAETKFDAIAIPGILRLSATEAAKLKQVDNKIATSEHGPGQQRARQHQQRDGNAMCIAQQHMSPVHQLKRTTQQPTWFDAANVPKELATLHDILTSLMQRNAVLENWEYFLDTHNELQEIFRQLQLNNLKFCCEQKVDTYFWKLLYYNVRDCFKNQNTTVAHTHILTLIDNGLTFYTDLHAQLNAKYLTPTATVENKRATSKFEFIAKVAAQKLLICLGDLQRYKVKHLQTNDYAEAAKYYQRAQALIPTNGIPYNQLAIVAIHARKKFDAIYYHMRSLMSSNAIYSARESLLVLFDEIRKKYDETELKTSPAHQNHNHKRNNKHSKSMRKEVWIYPDGERRVHRTDAEDNGHGNKLSTAEEHILQQFTPDDLFRRFTSLYLYVIGKFYTGIGMESIQQHQRKLLIQLKVLLQRDNLIITRTRMLKMVALNIFILEHNRHKEARREIRYHAFIFCNKIFGFMLHKTNQLLNIYANNENELDEQSFMDLNTLLEFIKIYTDWLKLNVGIWEPTRCEELACIDCWTELQTLFANLKRLPTQQANLQNIILEEDIFLNGFTPLSTLATAKQINDTTQEQPDFLQFHLRILRILNFEACYNENQQRLAFAETTHFILDDLNAAIENALDKFDSDGDDDDDNSENIVSNGWNEPCNGATTEMKMKNETNTRDAQITQLSKLKRELEAKTQHKKMYTAKLEEILKFVDTKLYIEVRPKYLLPDTNCFIDCLEDFEKLTHEFKRYTLIIPLTVVKELDGLSKGVKLESSNEKTIQKQRIHHFDDVSTRAKKSLDFIKTAKNNVKCATTKGSIINASLFGLVEEEHVSNDDKILATALALTKTLSTETNKDGKCFIQTELVLITTDRNLRVKALSRNLAVCELSEFVQWANKDCHA